MYPGDAFGLQGGKKCRFGHATKSTPGIVGT